MRNIFVASAAIAIATMVAGPVFAQCAGKNHTAQSSTPIVTAPIVTAQTMSTSAASSQEAATSSTVAQE